VICTALGIFFYTVHGWPILILGLIGLFDHLIYTPWLNKVPALCLVAPGIGFGNPDGQWDVFRVDRSFLLACFPGFSCSPFPREQPASPQSVHRCRC
jgi:hypothetical protein